MSHHLLCAILLAVQDDPEAVLRRYLQAHCVECHGEEVRKRDLRLDPLPRDAAKPESFATWVKVHDKIESGEMPPAKRERPSKEDSAAVLRLLKKDLQKADLARRQGEGRSVSRRLNRVEYENTLRDLLALPQLMVEEHLRPGAAARAAGSTRRPSRS